MHVRIAKLDPSFKATGSPTAAGGGDDDALVRSLAGSAGDSDEGLIENAGDIEPEELAYARELIQELPRTIREAVHEPYSARAVVYALVLGREDELRVSQMKVLNDREKAPVVEETDLLRRLVARLPRRLWLPVVDLALPTLRQLTAAQYLDFKETVKQLVEVDDKINLFEFTLMRVLRRHLTQAFERPRGDRVRIRSVDKVSAEVALVLSGIGLAGHRDPVEAEQAFRAGAQDLIPGEALTPRGQIQMKEYGAALERLQGASHTLKRSILTACERVARFDHKITVTEAELSRAGADTLGCPVPPVVRSVAA
jgi:hypothetical protein